MGSKDKILQALKGSRSGLSSSELTKELNISRQMVARHLRELTDQGFVSKSGSTRNSIYTFNTQPRKPNKVPGTKALKLDKSLDRAHEEDIFREIELRLGLKALVPDNVHSILYYAFTEMLNNAIDHSSSTKAHIEFKINMKMVEFTIRDMGIGVFYNVQNGFSLPSEIEAADHVFKGKQTTAPEAHSGQGLFFTSRIADRFLLKSHRLQYLVNNKKNIHTLADIRNIKGTSVHFSILRQSRKRLEKLFLDYADSDFEFDRGDVYLKLHKGKKLISRSQAKRLLAGLQDYKIITLDFQNVSELGQGFADEIFRVFKLRHPQIQIVFRNASPAVEFMIKRSIQRETR